MSGDANLRKRLEKTVNVEGLQLQQNEEEEEDNEHEKFIENVAESTRRISPRLKVRWFGLQCIARTPLNYENIESVIILVVL